MSRRPLMRLMAQIMGTSQDSARPVRDPSVKGGLSPWTSSRNEWVVIHWMACLPPSGSSARLHQTASVRPRRRMTSLPTRYQITSSAPSATTTPTRVCDTGPQAKAFSATESAAPPAGAAPGCAAAGAGRSGGDEALRVELVPLTPLRQLNHAVSYPSGDRLAFLLGGNQAEVDSPASPSRFRARRYRELDVVRVNRVLARQVPDLQPQGIRTDRGRDLSPNPDPPPGAPDSLLPPLPLRQDFGGRHIAALAHAMLVPGIQASGKSQLAQGFIEAGSVVELVGAEVAHHILHPQSAAVALPAPAGA